jgi:hypothetical protein
MNGSVRAGDLVSSNGFVYNDPLWIKTSDLSRRGVPANISLIRGDFVDPNWPREANSSILERSNGVRAKSADENISLGFTTLDATPTLESSR